MNNSNPRDVQDLIAEFVTSKNQLLHEEIISSIKKESFSKRQQEEAAQEEAIPQMTDQETQVNTGNKENTAALLQKIEALTARNLELQQELTILQMQESQTIASAKPIGTDDLRMEFLNFTSAHIQQFNTRIKRTEELIESQIQKNQQPAENKSRGDFPLWLFWTNIAALSLIAIYFLFSLFSSNDHESVAENTEVTTQAATIQTTPAAQTVEAQPVSANKATEATETNIKSEVPAATTTFSATPSNAEAASTPFRKAGTAVSNTTATAANSIPKNENKPVTNREATVNNNSIIKQNAAVVKERKAGNEIVTPAPKVANKVAPAATMAPKKQNTVSVSRTIAKQPAASENPKPKTEKKSAPQEKVYFGED